MNKAHIILCSLLIAFIVLSTGHVVISQSIKEFDRFYYEAEKYLGTNDFELTMTDILIARTKNGRQYPSKEVVNAYYRSQLITYCGLGLFGFLGLSLVALCLENNESKEKGEI